MNGPEPPLSDSAIVATARAEGFAGESLVTMVATILAESGGDPDNVGDEGLVNNIWGPSEGLAQIRSLWAQKGTGGPRDPDRLFDPRFNLRSAWQISAGGTSFQPWSAYTSGRYRSYLERARAAVLGTPEGTGLPSSVRGLTGGIPGSGIVDDLVKGLQRISLVGVILAGGVVLVVAGAWKAVNMTDRVRDRAQEAAQIAAVAA